MGYTANHRHEREKPMRIHGNWGGFKFSQHFQIKPIWFHDVSLCFSGLLVHPSRLGWLPLTSRAPRASESGRLGDQSLMGYPARIRGQVLAFCSLELWGWWGKICVRYRDFMRFDIFLLDRSTVFILYFWRLSATSHFWAQDQAFRLLCPTCFLVFSFLPNRIILYAGLH